MGGKSQGDDPPGASKRNGGLRPIGRFVRRITLSVSISRTSSRSPVSGWSDVQRPRNFAVIIHPQPLTWPPRTFREGFPCGVLAFRLCWDALRPARPSARLAFLRPDGLRGLRPCVVSDTQILQMLQNLPVTKCIQERGAYAYAREAGNGLPFSRFLRPGGLRSLGLLR